MGMLDGTIRHVCPFEGENLAKEAAQVTIGVVS